VLAFNINRDYNMIITSLICVCTHGAIALNIVSFVKLSH